MTKIHTPESGHPPIATEGLRPAHGLILAGVIALFAILSLYLQTPPAPLPESAPPQNFSAARAMKHLRFIASAPHPLGTAHHKAVRDYIVGELNSLGLSPEVQRTVNVTPRPSGVPHRAATIENIIGRVQGANGGRPIMLLAHYDSAPNSPGASDDGSGVVTLLETARALKSGAPPKNDVIFLFTDGEEPGLLGAEAFIGEHPAAKNVGLVANFEARGAGGPVVMFETSDNNGRLIREFADAARNPIANSLSYEIYKRLPNDTDLTVFKKAGYEGLNFAYINQLNRYHTAGDSLENIDERSVQAQGSYALALATHAWDLGPGRRQDGNAIYFNLPGSFLVHYPQWLVLPLTALVALLFVGAVVLGVRRGALSVRGLALGFVAVLACGVASWLAATLAWKVVVWLHRDYAATPWGDVYNGWMYALGFVFMAVAICSAIYGWFRRRAGAYDLLAGGLVWWALLMVGVSLFVPGGSYLFTWPLLFAVAALYLLTTAKDGSGVKRLVVLALYAVPGIIFLVPLIELLFNALTLSASGVILLLEVLLLALLAAPLGLLTRPGRRALTGACALAAAGLIVAGLLTAGSDRRHPKTENIFYVLESDTGAAAWVSSDDRPHERTRQFFGDGNDRDALTNVFPLNKRRLMKGAAPAVTLPPPQVELLEDQTGQEGRTLRLRITSPRGGANLWAYVDASSKVVAAAVNGKAIAPVASEARNDPEPPWAITYLGLPEEGLELKLTVRTNQPVKLRVDDRTYGLPQVAGSPVQARPDYIIPTPSPLSDVTIVSKSFVF
ncbi:MAG TPA: M20/M25/M40 family metallo-hydrolase [Pyrinomonadaceae bacterium]|jgi:hypothetical protein